MLIFWKRFSLISILFLTLRQKNKSSFRILSQIDKNFGKKLRLFEHIIIKKNSKKKLSKEIQWIPKSWKCPFRWFSILAACSHSLFSFSTTSVKLLQEYLSLETDKDGKPYLAGHINGRWKRETVTALARYLHDKNARVAFTRDYNKKYNFVTGTFYYNRIYLKNFSWLPLRWKKCTYNL